MRENIFQYKEEAGGRKKQSLAVFFILFVLTFVTCMIAGAQWAFKDFLEITNWHYGIEYAVLILFFLSSHEFGHYFAAKYHGVDASLPYYIPYPLTFTINFGTFGAVIRTRSPIPNRKAMFDIGVAGPIAGFIVCSAYLIYGLATLPGIEYIYHIHPEYITQLSGGIPKTGLYFGDTIYYELMSEIFANPKGFLPPLNEIYHYPFLNVGWFGLFVTSLNMLPMGQLDGGHTTFAMFGGKVHYIIAQITFWFLLIIGAGASLGVIHSFFSANYDYELFQLGKELLYPPLNYIKENFPIVYKGWSGWLLWSLVARFLIKLKHPPVDNEQPLDTKRKIIGWAALIILLLSFSFNGIYIVE